VRAIINGMSVFVLTAPNTRVTSDNVTLLEDHVRSSKEMCCILIGHLMYTETLPPDQLPLQVPIVLYGERMQTHPYAITGSFACHVKKVSDANVVVIPYRRNARGVQITDLVVIQPPALPPIPVAPPPVQPPVGGAPPAVAPVVDPNAALLQGVLAAIQAMTQMNIGSDLRNASLTQQQSLLQAASMRANQL